MPLLTPHVPTGLIDLMKDLAKEVLRDKPENIYEFAVVHFEKLILERDGSLDKGYEEFSAFEGHFDGQQRFAVPSNRGYICQKPIKIQPIPQPRKSKSEIMASFQAMESINEEDALATAAAAPEGASPYTDEKYQNAIYVIQRYFRRYMERKKNPSNTKNESLSAFTAAIIIQRTMRRLFSNKIKLTKNKEKDSGPSLVTATATTAAAAVKLVQDDMDNVSEAASYTSSSTIQMLADGQEGRENRLASGQSRRQHEEVLDGNGDGDGDGDGDGVVGDVGVVGGADDCSSSMEFKEPSTQDEEPPSTSSSATAAMMVADDDEEHSHSVVAATEMDRKSIADENGNTEPIPEEKPHPPSASTTDDDTNTAHNIGILLSTKIGSNINNHQNLPNNTNNNHNEIDRNANDGPTHINTSSQLNIIPAGLIVPLNYPQSSLGSTPDTLPVTSPHLDETQETFVVHSLHHEYANENGKNNDASSLIQGDGRIRKFVDSDTGESLKIYDVYYHDVNDQEFSDSLNESTMEKDSLEPEELDADSLESNENVVHHQHHMSDIVKRDARQDDGSLYGDKNDDEEEDEDNNEIAQNVQKFIEIERVPTYLYGIHPARTPVVERRNRNRNSEEGHKVPPDDKKYLEASTTGEVDGRSPTEEKSEENSLDSKGSTSEESSVTQIENNLELREIQNKASGVMEQPVEDGEEIDGHSNSSIPEGLLMRQNEITPIDGLNQDLKTKEDNENTMSTTTYVEPNDSQQSPKKLTESSEDSIKQCETNLSEHEKDKNQDSKIDEESQKNGKTNQKINDISSSKLEDSSAASEEETTNLVAESMIHNKIDTSLEESLSNNDLEKSNLSEHAPLSSINTASEELIDSKKGVLTENVEDTTSQLEDSLGSNDQEELNLKETEVLASMKTASKNLIDSEKEVLAESTEDSSKLEISLSSSDLEKSNLIENEDLSLVKTASKNFIDSESGVLVGSIEDATSKLEDSLKKHELEESNSKDTALLGPLKTTSDKKIDSEKEILTESIEDTTSKLEATSLLKENSKPTSASVSNSSIGDRMLLPEKTQTENQSELVSSKSNQSESNVKNSIDILEKQDENSSNIPEILNDQVKTKINNEQNSLDKQGDDSEEIEPVDQSKDVVFGEESFEQKVEVSDNLTLPTNKITNQPEGITKFNESRSGVEQNKNNSSSGFEDTLVNYEPKLMVTSQTNEDGNEKHSDHDQEIELQLQELQNLNDDLPGTNLEDIGSEPHLRNKRSVDAENHKISQHDDNNNLEDSYNQDEDTNPNEKNSFGKTKDCEETSIEENEETNPKEKNSSGKMKDCKESSIEENEETPEKQLSIDKKTSKSLINAGKVLLGSLGVEEDKNSSESSKIYELSKGTNEKGENKNISKEESEDRHASKQYQQDSGQENALLNIKNEDILETSLEGISNEEKVKISATDSDSLKENRGSDHISENSSQARTLQSGPGEDTKYLTKDESLENSESQKTNGKKEQSLNLDEKESDTKSDGLTSPVDLHSLEESKTHTSIDGHGLTSSNDGSEEEENSITQKEISSMENKPNIEDKLVKEKRTSSEDNQDKPRKLLDLKTNEKSSLLEENAEEDFKNNTQKVNNYSNDGIEDNHETKKLLDIKEQHSSENSGCSDDEEVISDKMIGNHQSSNALFAEDLKEDRESIKPLDSSSSETKEEAANVNLEGENPQSIKVLQSSEEEQSSFHPKQTKSTDRLQDLLSEDTSPENVQNYKINEEKADSSKDLEKTKSNIELKSLKNQNLNEEVVSEKNVEKKPTGEDFHLETEAFVTSSNTKFEQESTKIKEIEKVMDEPELISTDTKVEADTTSETPVQDHHLETRAAEESSDKIKSHQESIDIKENEKVMKELEKNSTDIKVKTDTTSEDHENLHLETKEAEVSSDKITSNRELIENNETKKVMKESERNSTDTISEAPIQDVAASNKNVSTELSQSKKIGEEQLSPDIVGCAGSSAETSADFSSIGKDLEFFEDTIKYLKNATEHLGGMEEVFDGKKKEDADILNHSAVLIQSAFRGYQVRKGFKELNQGKKRSLDNEETNSESNDEKKVNAAIKIQSAYRGHQVRKDQKKKLNEEETIRQQIAENILPPPIEATNYIQSPSRSVLGNNLVKSQIPVAVIHPIKYSTSKKEEGDQRKTSERRASNSKSTSNDSAVSSPSNQLKSSPTTSVKTIPNNMKTTPQKMTRQKPLEKKSNVKNDSSDDIKEESSSVPSKISVNKNDQTFIRESLDKTVKMDQTQIIKNKKIINNSTGYGNKSKNNLKTQTPSTADSLGRPKGSTNVRDQFRRKGKSMSISGRTQNQEPFDLETIKKELLSTTFKSLPQTGSKKKTGARVKSGKQRSPGKQSKITKIPQKSPSKTVDPTNKQIKESGLPIGTNANTVSIKESSSSDLSKTITLELDTDKNLEEVNNNTKRPTLSKTYTVRSSLNEVEHLKSPLKSNDEISESLFDSLKRDVDKLKANLHEKSAVTIQKNFRGYRTRKNLNKGLKNSPLGALGKSNSAQENIIETSAKNDKKGSSKNEETMTKDNLKDNEKDKENNSVEETEKENSMFVEKLPDPALDKAAIKIQKTYRGYKTRENYKTLNEKRSEFDTNEDITDKITKPGINKLHQDGEIGSKESINDSREKSAITIQKTYRGYQSRKKLQTKKISKVVKNEDSGQQEVDARVTPPPQTLSTHSRPDDKQNEETPGIFESLQNSIKYYKNSLLHESATTIQKHYRGYKIRKDINTNGVRSGISKINTNVLDINTQVNEEPNEEKKSIEHNEDIEKEGTKEEEEIQETCPVITESEFKEIPEAVDQHRSANLDKSATIIQKNFRAYRTRQHLKGDNMITNRDPNEKNISEEEGKIEEKIGKSINHDDQGDPDTGFDGKEFHDETLQKSAITIQKTFKGFKTRKDLLSKKTSSNPKEDTQNPKILIQGSTEDQSQPQANEGSNKSIGIKQAETEEKIEKTIDTGNLPQPAADHTSTSKESSNEASNEIIGIKEAEKDEKIEKTTVSGNLQQSAEDHTSTSKESSNEASNETVGIEQAETEQKIEKTTYTENLQQSAEDHTSTSKKSSNEAPNKIVVIEQAETEQKIEETTETGNLQLSAEEHTSTNKDSSNEVSKKTIGIEQAEIEQKIEKTTYTGSLQKSAEDHTSTSEASSSPPGKNDIPSDVSSSEDVLKNIHTNSNYPQGSTKSSSAGAVLENAASTIQKAYRDYHARKNNNLPIKSYSNGMHREAIPKEILENSDESSTFIGPDTSFDLSDVESVETKSEKAFNSDKISSSEAHTPTNNYGEAELPSTLSINIHSEDREIDNESVNTPQKLRLKRSLVEPTAPPLDEILKDEESVSTSPKLKWFVGDDPIIPSNSNSTKSSSPASASSSSVDPLIPNYSKLNNLSSIDACGDDLNSNQQHHTPSINSAVVSTSSFLLLPHNKEKIKENTLNNNSGIVSANEEEILKKEENNLDEIDQSEDKLKKLENDDENTSSVIKSNEKLSNESETKEISETKCENNIEDKQEHTKEVATDLCKNCAEGIHEGGICSEDLIKTPKSGQTEEDPSDPIKKFVLMEELSNGQKEEKPSSELDAPNITVSDANSHAPQNEALTEQLSSSKDCPAISLIPPSSEDDTSERESSLEVNLDQHKDDNVKNEKSDKDQSEDIGEIQRESKEDTKGKKNDATEASETKSFNTDTSIKTDDITPESGDIDFEVDTKEEKNTIDEKETISKIEATDNGIPETKQVSKEELFDETKSVDNSSIEEKSKHSSNEIEENDSNLSNLQEPLEDAFKTLPGEEFKTEQHGFEDDFNESKEIEEVSKGNQISSELEEKALSTEEAELDTIVKKEESLDKIENEDTRKDLEIEKVKSFNGNNGILEENSSDVKGLESKITQEVGSHELLEENEKLTDQKIVEETASQMPSENQSSLSLETKTLPDSTENDNKLDKFSASETMKSSNSNDKENKKQESEQNEEVIGEENVEEIQKDETEIKQASKDSKDHLENESSTNSEDLIVKSKVSKEEVQDTSDATETKITKEDEKSFDSDTHEGKPTSILSKDENHGHLQEDIEIAAKLIESSLSDPQAKLLENKIKSKESTENNKISLDANEDKTQPDPQVEAKLEKLIEDNLKPAENIKNTVDIKDLPTGNSSQEVVEEPCVKTIIPPPTPYSAASSDPDESELESTTTKAESTATTPGYDETSETDALDIPPSKPDALDAMTEKLREPEEMVARMRQRRASEHKISIDSLTDQQAVFEGPISQPIKPMQQIQKSSSTEVEDDFVLRKLERGDTTRESSAQSESVVYGDSTSQLTESEDTFNENMDLHSLHRMNTIAVNRSTFKPPHHLYKSVTIDNTVKYIDPEKSTEESGSSFCMDDALSEDVRKKIMAYSVSEADSDYYEVGDQTAHPHDDFNISTALDNFPSTDTDTTIVSAATKIQAGARGFLTRRRIRRASMGTKASLTEERNLSFGNDAIGESLDQLAEEEDGRRQFNRQTGVNSLPSALEHSDEMLSPSLGEDIPSIGTITSPAKNFSIKIEDEKHIKRATSSAENDVNDWLEKKPEDDSSHVVSNLEATLARRLTLQRGDAMRNDSTPDDENNGNGKQVDLAKNNTTSSMMGTELFHEKTMVESTTTTTTRTTTERRNYSDAGVSNKKEKIKWFALRQNSMPVQIDSEIFRVLPKHMRKRIKSAEGEKPKRIRFPRD